MHGIDGSSIEDADVTTIRGFGILASRDTPVSDLLDLVCATYEGISRQLVFCIDRIFSCERIAKGLP